MAEYLIFLSPVTILKIIIWKNNNKLWLLVRKQTLSNVHKSGRGFRICYPKIRHLGLLTISSWRCWKKWQKQAGYSDLLACLLFCPEAGHKHSWERCHPLGTGKEHPSLRTKGSQEESSQMGLTRFSQFTTITSYSLTYPISPELSTHHTCHLKCTSLTVFWGLHFLMKAPGPIKLILKNVYAFLLLTCLCQLNFYTQPGSNPKRVEENVSISTSAWI